MMYPPTFYWLEGGLYALLGPSPFVAKGLVLAFALLAGVYTLAWLRPVMARQVTRSLQVRDANLVDDIVGEAVGVILEEIRAGRVIHSIVSFARTIAHHVGCALIEREVRQARIAEALESARRPC